MRRLFFDGQHDRFLLGRISILGIQAIARSQANVYISLYSKALRKESIFCPFLPAPGDHERQAFSAAGLARFPAGKRRRASAPG
jgi:hypothetical protein